MLVLHRSPAGYLDDDNDCDDVIMMMMRSSMINMIMRVLDMIEGLMEMLIIKRMRNWRTKNIFFTFSQFAASHPLNLGLLSSSPKVLGLKHHHYPERSHPKVYGNALSCWCRSLSDTVPLALGPR